MCGILATNGTIECWGTFSDVQGQPTGQATPPCATGVVTLRIRVRKPLPQVCVQLFHACHAEVTQSTGHGFDLQASTS